MRENRVLLNKISDISVEGSPPNLVRSHAEVHQANLLIHHQTKENPERAIPQTQAGENCGGESVDAEAHPGAEELLQQ